MSSVVNSFVHAIGKMYMYMIQCTVDQERIRESVQHTVACTADQEYIREKCICNIQ